MDFFTVSDTIPRKRTLIVGPMGSGKSTMLHSAILKAGVMYSKAVRSHDIPVEGIIDTLRTEVMIIVYDEETGFGVQKSKAGLVRSGEMKLHSGFKVPIPTSMYTSMVTVVNSAKYKMAKLIVVDEGQFFSDLDVLFLYAIRDGKDVLVAGLDKDVKLKPFPSIAKASGLATSVIKKTGTCENCHLPATHTVERDLNRRRQPEKKEGSPAEKKSGEEVVLNPGGFEKYMVICDICLKNTNLLPDQ